MLTNTKVTIYNRYQDKESDGMSYYRTVIPAAHWEDNISVSDRKTSHKFQGETSVCIPRSVIDGMSKKFVRPDVFSRLPPAEREKSWTIACGSIVLQGVITEEIPSRGHREFIANHPDAREVTSIDTCFYGSYEMQHLEVDLK